MLFSDQLQQLNWRIILDIGLVAALCYQTMNMLKGTRAVQVLIGIIIIFIAYAMSGYLELNTLNWIISKFYSSIIVVVIVLFQDDLRRLLTRVGRGPFVQGMDEDVGVRAIDEAINAARTLSHERAGAIIVFERGIGLDRLYDHSVKIDALVSEQLLLSIFQSFSPLHDGAVIIQKGRLSCASAQLPLSKNPSFSKKMGTRHSAAVGISEETDAVVLVVSEETGNISIAWDGQMQRQPNADITRRLLMTLLVPQTREKATGLLRLTQPIKNWWWDMLNGTSSKKQNKEFAGSQRRSAWGDKKSASDNDSRAASASRQMTTTGTVTAPGSDSQRWSMTLRLPRHQAVRARKPEVQSIPPAHVSLGTPELELETLHADYEEESKENHRFDPPMPPEPPPRDVTVGGVPLDPPMDTTEPASSQSEDHEPKHPSSAADKKGDV
ncbi:MAG: TIGR00159 family protein [Betaproteobacteria bacterium]|nr:TIGR00159 family protein [Betaproteobacteria bacterium]